MLKIFTVSFFGHRKIDNIHLIEDLLENEIYNLLNKNEYVDFLIGRTGDFDRLASSTIRKIKRNFRDDNSSLVLVLPYMTSEYKNNTDSIEAYYDDIEIPYESSIAHFKSAYQIRNRIMVDRSDLIICYINKKDGGAYQTVKYAKEQNKKTLNLVDLIE